MTPMVIKMLPRRSVDMKKHSVDMKKHRVDIGLTWGLHRVDISLLALPTIFFKDKRVLSEKMRFSRYRRTRFFHADANGSDANGSDTNGKERIKNEKT